MGLQASYENVLYIWEVSKWEAASLRKWIRVWGSAQLLGCLGRGLFHNKTINLEKHILLPLHTQKAGHHAVHLSRIIFMFACFRGKSGIIRYGIRKMEELLCNYISSAGSTIEVPEQSKFSTYSSLPLIHQRHREANLRLPQTKGGQQPGKVTYTHIHTYVQFQAFRWRLWNVKKTEEPKRNTRKHRKHLLSGSNPEPSCSEATVLIIAPPEYKIQWSLL